MQDVGHERRSLVLVDDCFDAVPLTFAAPDHRNATAAAGNNDRAAFGDHLDQ